MSDPTGSTLVREYVNDDGATVHEVYEDGFRPRKLRPKGWLEKAYLDGSVRRPGAPDPDLGRDYSKAHVIRVPIARATGDGIEPG